MNAVAEVASVPIHLRSIEPGIELGSGTPAPARSCRATYATYLLTTDDPIQEILPASDDRIVAYVQAIDADIVIGHDAGTVGAVGNLSTGDGLTASGALIPGSATPAPWPIQDAGKVLAGITGTSGTADPTRVTVTAYYWA